MSGTIVDFSLENAATANSATQYIRFNQIFAEGDLPQGQSLSSVIGTRTVALQMDVLSRYADGSVKSAILTAAAPAIAAGATLQGSLVASSATAGAAIATDAALAQGYDLTVNMNISGLGAVTINAAQKLAAAVAGGDFEVLRQGALATEIRFDVAVTRALRVTFDVVTYADGSVSTKVAFQNDAAMGATGGAVLFNSLSIVEGGTTRFSTTNLTQYQYQVWAQDVTQDSSAKQTLNIRHDIDYLERTGAIWNYDLTATVSAAPSVPSSWTNVLGVNELFQYMPTTGARPDIGPTTEANARWLMTQDASAATYALAQAQAAGSIPWHYYDTAKSHYLSVADYPKLWIDPRGSLQPSQLAGDESGWTTDRAHSPDVSYVAWLMTGDRYHLDMLNAQASWVIANTWNAYRQDAQGIVTHRDEEARAQAWALRTVQEAAFANPDGSYEKAYFTQIANNNWASLRATTAKLSTTQDEVHGYIEGNYRDVGAIAPWQQDFFASTTALAALQGNEDARAVLKWQANFLSGRFLSPDLDPYNGFNYSLNVYGSDGSALSSWAEVAAASRAAGNYSTGPFTGYWAELAAMSNANIITVFAGGEDPTDHRVAADAMRAYGWILGAGMPDLRTDPQYQVVPRMPDGTQIGVTEMRVVAPTTQNTTLTFTGGNVFAYDRGIGRTTLNGTAGSDVMIDNSTTGGDRLAGQGGDDYLIGGIGSNIFAPGDGQDYALIRGGAARFEVSATSTGRLEIEGFRPGTDIIILTGTVSLASILASARSDGFGGTLVTISPGRSIRLNGLAPSRITGTMFDTGSVLPPDIIFGTPGSDTLVGTAGADTMEGGAGNDFYYVDNAGDQVIEAAGGGSDNVYASVNYVLGAGQEVEVLRVYSLSGLTLTGNELANTLVGGTANDTLNGGGGNDTLFGDLGADVMVGGSGNDIYYVDNAGDQVVEAAGGGTDNLYASINYTLGAGQDVEVLRVYSSAGLTLTGNELASTLVGASGNDTLNGGGGNDTLFGDLGADVMAGGSGNDSYYVDNAGDQVIEAAGGGSDNVYASVNYTLGASQEVEVLQVYGSAGLMLTGNELANALVGGTGNDTLNGGGGADTMAGGSGNDVYYVDNAGDQMIEAAGGGTDNVYASVNHALGAGQEVEVLRVYSLSGLTLTGNELANTLVGGTANDTLNGGGGNDTLFGDLGADVMAGGSGNDIYYVDNAGDQVIEAAGGGSDNVYASVNYTLVAGQEVEVLRVYSSAGLTLTGNELANTLVGASGNDTLNGGGGNDTLFGDLGADVMSGGSGNDTYYVDNAGDQVIEAAGGGTDNIYSTVSWSMAAGQEIESLRAYGAGATSGVTLIGNEFNNALVGGSGNDVLNGGAGNDTLVGGAGNDVFRFSTTLGSNNIDTISDLNTSGDSIQLDHTAFSGLALGQLSASAFALDSANGAGPQIVYNHITGALFFDSNGAAAGGATQFALVTGAPGLNASYFSVI